MPRLGGLLQNVPKLPGVLQSKPHPKQSAPSVTHEEGYCSGGTSSLPEPFEGIEIHGHLQTGLARALGAGSPGTLVSGEDHKWVLTREQAPQVLVDLAKRAYIVCSEPELKDALGALETLAGSMRDGFTWNGPLLERKVALGDRADVFVRIEAKRRRDGKLEVKASFPGKVESRIVGQVKTGYVARTRTFDESYPGRRNVDGVADAVFRGWPQGIAEPNSEDSERRRQMRDRAFERARRASHQAAILALFHELWPTNVRPDLRNRARERVEVAAKQTPTMTGKELLAAMLVLGARAQVRKAAEKLNGGELSMSGRCAFEARPVDELLARLLLLGTFKVQTNLNEPITSDFLVNDVRVRVEATGTHPVRQADLDGAAAILEDLLENAEVPTSTLPPFRTQAEGAGRDVEAFLAAQTAAMQAEKVKHFILKRDGSPGPNRKFEATGLLYYGNGYLELEATLRDGIPPKPRAQVFDLVRHQKDDPRSGLRGSCQSPETPAGFADEGGYVYALFPVGGAIDLQVLDFEKDSKQASGACGENEYAFGSCQPAHVIVGAFPVGETIAWDRTDRRIGPFIPNPHANPALIGRLPPSLRKHFEGAST